MKSQIKLKWFIILIFLTLSIVLVAGYTKLSANYFILGMDTMIASNMEQAASQHLGTIPKGTRLLANDIDRYPITATWQQQPAVIRAIFPTPPMENGVLLKVENFDAPPGERGVYFTMRQQQHGEVAYISLRLSRETISNMVHRSINRTLDSLLLIGVIAGFTLAMIIWLVLRRVSRPVTALWQWTRELKPSTLTQTPPDFSYPELNEMAELIRASLTSVQESLDREHRFLRHTSHELRTPISVIRNNVELLHRLQAEDKTSHTPRSTNAIDRIDRASLTMKNLTETLLWLNRDNTEDIPYQNVELNMLVPQLVEDLRYLLRDKRVEVEIHTQPYTAQLPEVVVRIILGNLIRNAFQHTWEGRVVIQQKNGQVEIHNDQQLENTSPDDSGFGLGLQLTAQLTQHMGWTYSNTSNENEHVATVNFASN